MCPYVISKCLQVNFLLKKFFSLSLVLPRNLSTSQSLREQPGLIDLNKKNPSRILSSDGGFSFRWLWSLLHLSFGSLFYSWKGKKILFPKLKVHNLLLEWNNLFATWKAIFEEKTFSSCLNHSVICDLLSTLFCASSSLHSQLEIFK